MPKKLFKNGAVIVNGVNLSSDVESIAFDASTPQVDVTSMGATARQYLAGFRDDSVDVTFYSDDDASMVTATLYPLFNGGSIFSLKIASDSSIAYSATNPTYSGSAVITDYPIISGKVGDALTSMVKFKPYGALAQGTT